MPATAHVEVRISDLDDVKALLSRAGRTVDQLRAERDRAQGALAEILSMRSAYGAAAFDDICSVAESAYDFLAASERDRLGLPLSVEPEPEPIVRPAHPGPKPGPPQPPDEGRSRRHG